MTETVSDAKLVQYLTRRTARRRSSRRAPGPHRDDDAQAVQEAAAGAPEGDQGALPRSSSGASSSSAAAGPQLADKVAGQAAGKAKSLAKGPLHMVRGTGEAEKMLKNAKTEYFNEHEEIATYPAIEALAESVGDKETAKLAREIRRDEERMANFLERQIPVLTKAVVSEEVPAAERRAASGGAQALGALALDRFELALDEIRDARARPSPGARAWTWSSASVRISSSASSKRSSASAPSACARRSPRAARPREPPR